MSVVSEEEPAAKRMKNSDEFPNLRAEVAGPVKEKLMELDAVQHQLDVMSEKAAEEILKVEQTFNKKRMPIYEKRKKLTTQIDSFWQVAFLNHHLLSTAIPEEQEDLLAAMRDLEVQEFDDLRSGFKIIMTFDKNPYFENEVIIKSYHLQSESPSTEITEIQWKENRKPAEKLDDVETSITFLEWLTYAAPPDSDEIAEVIKDDLYINPLQYYVMPDMQEVEEDDIEDFLNERKIDENGQPLLPLRNDIFIAPLMMPRRDVDDSGDRDDEPEEKMEEDLNGAEVKAEEDGDETVEPEDADETVGDTEAGDEEEEDEEDEEEEEDGEPAREAEDGEPADEEDTKDEVKEEIFE